jgi:hypothetical protein
MINSNHLSENPQKTEHATKFHESDFHEAHLFQADGLFNPKALKDTFYLG